MRFAYIKRYDQFFVPGKPSCLLRIAAFSWISLRDERRSFAAFAAAHRPSEQASAEIKAVGQHEKCHKKSGAAEQRELLKDFDFE